MVKYVSGLGAKLTQARKKIEKLEKQNELLVDENSHLVRENEILRASSGCSSPSQPFYPGLSTPSSDDYKTRRRETRYDTPTKASANRAVVVCNIKQTVERDVDSTKHVEIEYTSREFGTCKYDTYKYVNGKPVQTNLKPRYMEATSSSSAKATTATKVTTASSLWDEQTEQICDEQTWGEELQEGEDFWARLAEKNAETPDEDTSASDIDKVDESRKSNLLSRIKIMESCDDGFKDPFPGFSFKIASNIGFEIMKDARGIAQEAIWEAAEKFWPQIWRSVRDGPHLVRLGYAELQHYMGDYPNLVDLSLCGTAHGTVYECMLGMIDLRNAICHPCRHRSRSVDTIARYIKNLMKLTVALKDERRKDQARTLRDRLYREAADGFDKINNFAPLTLLPFAGEEKLVWESYQESMFEGILDDWSMLKDEEKELYSDMRQVAEMWEMQQE